MIDLRTVCNVYDAPAVPIDAGPDCMLLDVRIKSLDTGRIHKTPRAQPLMAGGRAYLEAPIYGYGELVAYDYRPIDMHGIDEWFADDTELPFCRNHIPRPSETPQEPEPADEAPQVVREDDAPQEPTEASPADLRTDIIGVMRTQDRAMTLRELILCLNMAYDDPSRKAVGRVLEDMEDKGLVKRCGNSNTGGRPARTWVIA